MRRRTGRSILAAAVLGGALTAASCGLGGGGDAPTPTATSAAPPLPSLTVTATPRVSATASPAPSASPSPSPVAASRAEVVAATEQALGARYVPNLTRAACLADNPKRLICFDLLSDDATLAAGVARFAAGDPEAGNFSFLMGRTAGGEWQFVRGTQQEFYELTKLPGTLRICSEGVDTAIRNAPGTTAAEVGRVKRLVTVDSDAFVLTKGSSLQTPGIPGEGYYRIAGATPGWVAARESSAASLNSCDLHDATEGTSHG